MRLDGLDYEVGQVPRLDYGAGWVGLWGWWVDYGVGGLIMGLAGWICGGESSRFCVVRRIVRIE